MFSVPTVIVIGAGAGKELNMPAGSDLSSEIAEKLYIMHRRYGPELDSGDYQLSALLQQIARKRKENYEDWRTAAIAVSRGISYTRSIDAYLNAHRDDEKIKVCGKLAITQLILAHEKDSYLYIDPHNPAKGFRDRTQVEKSWLSDFIFLLQDRIIKNENLENIFDNLCVINFNYDRCIEQFLFQVLQPLYRIDQDRASQLLQRFVIYHPYGQVGFMPWENGIPKVSFGVADYGDMIGLSEQIRTFNEQMEDRQELAEIRRRVAEAQRIIFLGFHFHTQNMELLNATPPARGGTVFAYATAFDRSAADRILIDEQIRRMLAGRGGTWDVHAQDQDCKGLFKDYGATWLR